ncbi:MAG: histidine phosphatase family protein [Bdellovibrionaceae bacterium]|nr:histidine phosphatase family protein [Bdellovibrio sp.]
MAELIFVRHAEAELLKTTDAVRSLTEKGQKQSQRLSKIFLQELSLIELFIQSDLVRSQETLLGLLDAHVPSRILTTDTLYEKPPIELAKWLKKNASGLQKILVVGHESQMSEFIGWGLARSLEIEFEIKKAGVARLEIHDFSNILEQKLILTELLSLKRMKELCRSVV